MELSDGAVQTQPNSINQIFYQKGPQEMKDVKESATRLSDMLRETNCKWFVAVGVADREGKDIIIVYHSDTPPSSFKMSEFDGFKIQLSKMVGISTIEDIDENRRAIESASSKSRNDSDPVR